MKALLIYPQTPRTFFSFPKLLRRAGFRGLMPPLSLLTVAALLPREWQLRLVDLSVEPMTEQMWSWPDLVLLSGMIIHRHSLTALIREAKARGKLVAVGGPIAHSLPDEVLKAGADFLVLGEGETSIPLFLEALAQGQRGGVIESDVRPELATSPIPRFDLVNQKYYANLPIQTSRGCPHDCEFCDVVQIYGRRPRYKEPHQVVAELEAIFRLGWRGKIFVCDDNFIANKTKTRAILQDLTSWSKNRGEPFVFETQVTVDLGWDVDLIDQLTEANFTDVFLGIETPEEEALIRSNKHHNRRGSMEEAIGNIKANGLAIMGSFILGMDGERPGTGERIISFIESTGIPLVIVNLLHAVPKTRLWQRLEKEGRLPPGGLPRDSAIDSVGGEQNFLPGRPREQIMAEYRQVWETVYDPRRFLARAYRYFSEMRPTRAAIARRQGRKLPPLPTPPANRPLRQDIRELNALLHFSWRLGVVLPSRRDYWRHILDLAKRNPSRLTCYLMACAHWEDLFLLQQQWRRSGQGPEGA
jgi:radical SAM superfamily enzyme YgiQ (UPF0313 family)